MNQEPAMIADPKTGEVTLLSVAIPSVARPLVTAEQGKADWDEYIALCNAILDAQDYQTISGKRFKKKSAWRKLARAFRVTDRIVEKHIERDSLGRPLWASFEVIAIYPNGQEATGYHECHVRERCCPNASGLPCPKSKYENHYCCAQSCDGWPHWSHPGDIPATAHTRAKNRAIADLIGAGEVTAEEMQDGEPPRAQGKPAAKRAAPRPPAKPSEEPKQEGPRDGPQTELRDALVEIGHEAAVPFLEHRAKALLEYHDNKVRVKWWEMDDNVAVWLLERLREITHPEPPDGEREPEEAPDTEAPQPLSDGELPFE